jgi:predicted HTH domain antitoxin
MGYGHPEASVRKLWHMTVATLMCGTLDPVSKEPDPEVVELEAELVAALRAHKAAEKLVDRRREELAETIVKAYRSGKLKASRIAKVTDYTPEHVRRILRAHGIEGDPTRLSPTQRARLAEPDA